MLRTQFCWPIAEVADGSFSTFHARVGDFQHGVEARQPQRGADAIQECGRPAELGQAQQGPFVDDQRRRGPETDHVGKAVVLGTERALRLGQARHPAIRFEYVWPFNLRDVAGFLKGQISITLEKTSP